MRWITDPLYSAAGWFSRLLKPAGWFDQELSDSGTRAGQAFLRGVEILVELGYLTAGRKHGDGYIPSAKARRKHRIPIVIPALSYVRGVVLGLYAGLLRARGTARTRLRPAIVGLGLGRLLGAGTSTTVAPTAGIATAAAGRVGARASARCYVRGVDVSTAAGVVGVVVASPYPPDQYALLLEELVA